MLKDKSLVKGRKEIQFQCVQQLQSIQNTKIDRWKVGLILIRGLLADLEKLCEGFFTTILHHKVLAAAYKAQNDTRAFYAEAIDSTV